MASPIEPMGEAERQLIREFEATIRNPAVVPNHLNDGDGGMCPGSRKRSVNGSCPDRSCTFTFDEDLGRWED